jgi:prepilin-type N-terminal cleavage/methylation domain-containing protein
MDFYKVTDVAARLKISKQTLLRYEKKGIFPKPKRNCINHWREYTIDDIKKMEQILGRSGFTLIELIMVILIMSTLAVLTIPRFKSFYFIQFSGAVKKVVSDIRYVQQLAVSRHEAYRIVFDPAQETYEVRRVSDNSYAVNPFGRNNFLVNFSSDAQYRGVNIVSANFGNTSALRFDWQGVPQNDAGVNLSSEGNVRFSYQDNNMTVYVTPNTGRVRVQ